MSSVRMCDKCGKVFSERTENWSTGQVIRFKRNEKTGKREQVADLMDLCADCGGDDEAPQPRMAELTAVPADPAPGRKATVVDSVTTDDDGSTYTVSAA